MFISDNQKETTKQSYMWFTNNMADPMKSQVRRKFVGSNKHFYASSFENYVSFIPTNII